MDKTKRFLDPIIAVRERTAEAQYWTPNGYHRLTAMKELGAKITTDAVELVHQADPSVAVQVELVEDRPAESILRAADEHDALAIVVGSAGRGPVAGALLGSVTYQVVHRSTRPVVVVPAPDSD